LFASFFSSLTLLEVPLILFGNKCDLVNQRQVSFDEAKEMARKLGSQVFEGMVFFPLFFFFLPGLFSMALFCG
jgi:hypothetical protein